MNSIDNIILNQIYNYFDDGKIRESRKMSVLITNIIPFDEIDEITLQLWQEEIDECEWLYAKETDYFIKGTLQTRLANIDIIFVRTIDNTWFSLGWWGGILDVDGSLSDLLCKNI